MQKDFRIQKGTPLKSVFRLLTSVITCQISDAVTSYGGYSGAPPNEKITWHKLLPEAPKFMVQSDATICAPLVFAHVLGW